MSTDLEQLHKDLYEIFKVFDEFCKKNDIKYSLAFGTLIGAVRHDGIIPWDDDIDVMMSRENYEKFRALAVEEFATGKDNRFVFTDYKTDKKYNLLYGKLFDTTKPFNSSNGLAHEEPYLWIDIFPFDYAPKNKFQKVMFYDPYLVFLNSGFSSKSFHWKGFLSLRNIKKLIFLPFPRNFIKHLYERFWKKNLKKKQKHPEKMITVCVNCHVKTSIKAFYYPIEYFENYELHKFEGGDHWIIKDYDPFLRSIFNDYMTPPPVEERVPKH